MTYNVSTGTLNTTIPYHTTDDAQVGLLCFPCFPCVAYFKFFEVDFVYTKAAFIAAFLFFTEFVQNHV